MEELRRDFGIREDKNPLPSITLNVYVNHLRTTLLAQLKRTFQNPRVRLTNPRSKMQQLKININPSLHKQKTKTGKSQASIDADYDSELDTHQGTTDQNPLHSKDIRKLLSKVTPSVLNMFTTGSRDLDMQILKEIVPEIVKRPRKEMDDEKEALTLACRRKKSIDSLYKRAEEQEIVKQ